MRLTASKCGFAGRPVGSSSLWRWNGCVVTGGMLLCISYFLALLPCTSPYLPATLTLLATKRAPHSRVRHACLGNIVCMCTVRVAHSFYEHMHLQHSIAHRLYNFVGFCGFMVCDVGVAAPNCHRTDNFYVFGKQAMWNASLQWHNIAASLR